MKSPISPEGLIDLAIRNGMEPIDVGREFVVEGHSFVFIALKVVDGKADTGRQGFIEYGYCVGYEHDDTADESVSLNYLSFEKFPPTAKSIAMTPAQAVSGKFRTNIAASTGEEETEFRLIPIEKAFPIRGIQNSQIEDPTIKGSDECEKCSS